MSTEVKEVKVEAEADVKAEAEAKAEAKAKAKAKAKAGTRAEAKADAKAETKAETKAEASAEAAEGKVEAKPVTPKKGKKRAKKNVATGVVHIRSTFNNTIVTVTDPSGNVIAWSSAGVCGFKGSRKSTPFAAQLAAEDAVRKATDHGLRSVTVLVSGPGAGRESALRVLQKTGVRVTGIRDVTPIPHNGCRAPKRRRM